MKIISCNCYKDKNAVVEYNEEDDTYDLNIFRIVEIIDSDKSYLDEDKIEYIKFCPFCGEKIIVDNKE